MRKALLSKELRECGLYAALALLAQVHFVGEGMDLPLVGLFSQGRGNEIPFLYGQPLNREFTFATIAVLAAVVMGLHQTIWESWRQTTLFLLHRPLPRTQIFLVKLGAGGLLLLGTTVLPLLVYSLWAAYPGTHASPFYWGMTESWWRCIGVAAICYLGAFLTGLRPARWLGSRTWPLIASLAVSMALYVLPFWVPPSSPLVNGLTLTGFLLLGAGFIVSILETARWREYP